MNVTSARAARNPLDALQGTPDLRVLGTKIDAAENVASGAVYEQLKSAGTIRGNARGDLDPASFTAADKQKMHDLLDGYFGATGSITAMADQAVAGVTQLKQLAGDAATKDALEPLNGADMVRVNTNAFDAVKNASEAFKMAANVSAQMEVYGGVARDNLDAFATAVERRATELLRGDAN